LVDALHAVKDAILEEAAAKDLQASVVEPLLCHRRVALSDSTRLHELKERALADRQRGDGAGLEIAMLADARRVDPLFAFAASAVKMDEAGVELVAGGNILARKQFADAAFRLGHEARQDRRKRLGRHTAIGGAARWPVVVEASELPVAEPVHGPQQGAL